MSSSGTRATGEFWYLGRHDRQATLPMAGFLRRGRRPPEPQTSVLLHAQRQMPWARCTAVHAGRDHVVVAADRTFTATEATGVPGPDVVGAVAESVAARRQVIPDDAGL